MTDVTADSPNAPAPDRPPKGADLALDFGLRDVVEALSFVSDRPLAPARVAEILDEDTGRVTAAISDLRTEYERGGLRILETNGRFQMATAPDAAPYCRVLLGLEPNQRLSQASLETLAIIAYRQPVTRANIEDVRGVNSDSTLSRLVAHGMVGAVGKSSKVGRPMLYGTTTGFLAYFGIDSLTKLPELDLPDFSGPSPEYVSPQLSEAGAEIDESAMEQSGSSDSEALSGKSNESSISTESEDSGAQKAELAGESEAGA